MAMRKTFCYHGWWSCGLLRHRGCTATRRLERGFRGLILIKANIIILTFETHTKVILTTFLEGFVHRITSVVRGDLESIGTLVATDTPFEVKAGSWSRGHNWIGLFVTAVDDNAFGPIGAKNLTPLATPFRSFKYNRLSCQV